MNTVLQARKDIRYIASLVRGLVALDAELEKAGGVQKFVAEKGDTLAALRTAEADLDERRGDLAAIEERISDRLASLDRINGEIGAIRAKFE